jgi:CRISPR-associated endonuclease/helicase Cas3
LEVAKREELPKAILEQVKMELAAAPQSTDEQSRIGIVVNRVVTAREVFSAIATALKDHVDVHLLIGRVRPIDRKRLMNDLAPALKSSMKPRRGERPIVVVATQTIEVGADFDFHTMFIESASYPAVRQRVGRLNRLGIRDTSRGALLLVRANAEEDPIYGTTILPTWATLQKAGNNGNVDLGIAHAPPGKEDTTPRAPVTPELSPSLLRVLAQTNPRPAVEPEVSPFLHGFGGQVADVSVVWRNGVSSQTGEVDENLATVLLDALPPLTLEAMSLPLSSFRSWLRSRTAKRLPKQVDAGDIEGDPFVEDDTQDEDTDVLLITEDGVKAEAVSQVAPGSMVVIPCSWGGADAYGFSPSSGAQVDDLSLLARKDSQRAPVLVFTKEVVSGWLRPRVSAEDQRDLVGTVATILAAHDGDDAEFDAAQARETCLDWIHTCVDSLREEVVDVASQLREQPTVVEVLQTSSGLSLGFLIRALRPKAGDLNDDDIGLQRTVEVALEEHCRGVAEYAARFASRLGLSEALQADLQLAGRLHDLGKADPRFQAMLGGDGSHLLAKGSSFDRRVTLGARHECYSVALLDRYPALLAEARDAALVRYLIGTHHGRGRGLQPVVEDRGVAFELELDGTTLSFTGKTELAGADSGWPALFADLQRRYGPWGIAYIETVLRLADHRRSEAEVEDARL